MDALANLGINGKLFLAQAINFLVLLFVLKRFAYRPMLEFLEKRTERIEKGLQDAEASEVRLKALGEKEKSVLAQAKSEARDLISQAEATAKKRDARFLAETEENAKRFLVEAEKRIAEEKDKMLAQVKKEIAETIVSGIEKVLKEKLDPEKDKKFIEHVIK